MQTESSQHSAVRRAIDASEEAPLCAYLTQEPDELVVRKMWTRISKETPALRRQAKWGWSLAVATVLCAAIVLSAWPESAPGPLALKGQGVMVAGESIATAEQARTIDFEEGSKIRLHRDSKLSVVSNDGPSMVFSLKRGAARFHVEPGGPRKWTVDAGDVVVSVLGTEFVVEKGKRSTTVRVSRGVVSVNGAVPGRALRLGAGQSIESLRRTDVPEERGEPRSRTGAGMRSSEDEPRVFTLDDVDPASEGDETSVLDAPRRVQRLPVEELLARADEHRTHGHTAEAAAALDEVVRRARPGDSRRALAALSYARLGTNPARSAYLLELTLTDMPEGLREAALGRLVEALGAAGRDEDASRFAEQYLREFPRGPRAERVRAEIER